MGWPVIAVCVWLAFNVAFVALRMWAARKHFLRCRTEDCGAAGVSPQDAAETSGPAFPCISHSHKIPR